MNKQITIESCHGHFIVNEAGVVLENHMNDEEQAYKDAVKFDLNEFHLWISNITGKLCAELREDYDILCVGCWERDGTYIPADLKHRESVAESNIQLLEEGNLTATVSFTKGTIELTLGEDTTTLEMPESETWYFTKVGGINIAAQIDFDSEENEQGFNIDVYTHSDISYNEAILSGKSLVDCMNFVDPVETIVKFA